MSALLATYDAERDLIIVVGYQLLTRDEAQALAEALTDAVDDAERVKPQT